MSAENNLDILLEPSGPSRLVIQAHLKPTAGQDRFQPAGFPEIGHVIYDAPRPGDQKEKVCIVDSPASMANHLESICLMGPHDCTLAQDLNGLPYVRCVTDRTFEVSSNDILLDPKTPHDRLVVTTWTEGHRLASDYFLDGLIDPNWEEAGGWQGTELRDRLKEEFQLVGLGQDKTFTPPESWWSIYRTIFRYDPNSLVHGILFPKWQIKIARLLTAHLEAFGAARVGTSGVKFDQLGKTASGQPIFSVDQETAREIRATFILDLAMLRSYGREVGDEQTLGLTKKQKKLLLGLSLWKVDRLLSGPFRFRSGCDLTTEKFEINSTSSPNGLSVEIKENVEAHYGVNMQSLIQACVFGASPVTDVYYPADRLFKVGADQNQETTAGETSSGEEDS